MAALKDEVDAATGDGADRPADGDESLLDEAGDDEAADHGAVEAF